MRYYRFPKLARVFYPGAIWDLPASDKSIYLTFDDGPNPETTPGLLELLKKNNVQATFFCTGDNVNKHPELFAQIQSDNHAVGNHTMTHLDAWKTNTADYIKDVEQAQQLIPSKLFRPSYGKLKLKQFKTLKKKGFTTVFWSVLSYDFDKSQSSEKMIQQMKRMCKPGDVIVFHDNPNCLETINGDLPILIDFWKEKNFQFKPIPVPPHNF